MLPAFPSLNIGKPVQRRNAVVYPVFIAQLPLFDKFAPEQPWSVATWLERKAVLACNHKSSGPKFPILMNPGNTPPLFLPRDRITGTLYLNCSILVPPQKKFVRVPNLCFTLAQRVRLGSPVVPPVDAVGWAAFGFHRWELHVFGNRQACRKAGYRRLTLRDPGTVAISDVKSFVNLAHRLPWERVKSVGIGRAWVATLGHIQAEVLFLDRQLVHLYSVKTL